MGPLPGHWLTCVTETRNCSFREHLRSRASPSLGMLVRAHGEWRGILSLTSDCMPELLLLFLSSLFSPTAWFSDLLTAFSCLLQPSGREIKRTGRIQSSWAGPSSLSWFVFCFPPFFFLKISVWLLCISLEFLFPLPSSFTAFNCFGAFVFPWT